MQENRQENAAIVNNNYNYSNFLYKKNPFDAVKAIFIYFD
jgi:hypothetical protein